MECKQLLHDLYYDLVLRKNKIYSTKQKILFYHYETRFQFPVLFLMLVQIRILQLNKHLYITMQKKKNWVKYMYSIRQAFSFRFLSFTGISTHDSW